ncbi:MAG: flagellar biosynthesis protein FlhB [Bdellovibrionaceae bacterium]|nr:flagellar biosynthesis protein FlhB [Pseudobdellovibrionaceae bacterium]
MAEENDEKTEEATQTRRDEFRKRGQVPQTKEFASAFFLLALAGVLGGLSRYFFQELHELFTYSYGGQLVAMIRQDTYLEAARFAGLKFVTLIAPFLGMSFVIGVGSSVLQTGFLQVEDALTPKFEKIDPLQGFKRMFSLRALSEGVKALLKMGLIAAVVYFLLRKEVGQMPLLINYSTAQLAAYVGMVSIKLFAGIGAAMIVLGAADFFFQRWDIEKKMMMTKQEVKEEMKNRELDPMIKARIRRVQREMANKRMMQKVPTADVIITNPTHIAVAIKYGADLPAPQLIAKGGDLVAEKIKEIAREHKIPIVENKPLARTIFKTMKIGQVIPRELYVAVAEVLSFVYRLRRKMKGRI